MAVLLVPAVSSWALGQCSWIDHETVYTLKMIVQVRCDACISVCVCVCAWKRLDHGAEAKSFSYRGSEVFFLQGAEEPMSLPLPTKLGGMRLGKRTCDQFLGTWTVQLDWPNMSVSFFAVDTLWRVPKRG